MAFIYLCFYQCIQQGLTSQKGRGLHSTTDRSIEFQIRLCTCPPDARLVPLDMLLCKSVPTVLVRILSTLLKSYHHQATETTLGTRYPSRVRPLLNQTQTETYVVNNRWSDPMHTHTHTLGTFHTNRLTYLASTKITLKLDLSHTIQPGR